MEQLAEELAGELTEELAEEFEIFGESFLLLVFAQDYCANDDLDD